MCCQQHDDKGTWCAWMHLRRGHRACDGNCTVTWMPQSDDCVATGGLLDWCTRVPGTKRTSTQAGDCTPNAVTAVRGGCYCRDDNGAGVVPGTPVSVLVCPSAAPPTPGTPTNPGNRDDAPWDAIFRRFQRHPVPQRLTDFLTLTATKIQVMEVDFLNPLLARHWQWRQELTP